MRRTILALTIAGLLAATGSMRAAVKYPVALTLDAQLKQGATTVNSKITLRVDQAMTEVRRTRVTDALKYGGYSSFYNALRGVPSVGLVQTQSAKVDIRYTREEQVGTSTRLVLVADQPLFFLGRDPAKQKAGFELTLVNLLIDDKGNVTGQLAGAARVRPSPDGGVLLDTYAEELVELKGQVPPS